MERVVTETGRCPFSSHFLAPAGLAQLCHRYSQRGSGQGALVAEVVVPRCPHNHVPTPTYPRTHGGQHAQHVEQASVREDTA